MEIHVEGKFTLIYMLCCTAISLMMIIIFFATRPTEMDKQCGIVLNLATSVKDYNEMLEVEYKRLLEKHNECTSDIAKLEKENFKKVK